MSDLSKFYQILPQSKLIILGFSYANERKKDEIISNLKNYEFVYNENSIIREDRLNKVLGIKKDYFIIDQSNISDVKKFLNIYRSISVNIILTIALNRGYRSAELAYLSGSTKYHSDLIFIVDDEKIVKSRFGSLSECN
jgi:hypothetical protein